MPSTATTHELATLSNAGDSMYIILSGRVKVYASDDTGKNAILDIFGPGEQVARGSSTAGLGRDAGAVDLRRLSHLPADQAHP